MPKILIWPPRSDLSPLEDNSWTPCTSLYGLIDRHITCDLSPFAIGAPYISPEPLSQESAPLNYAMQQVATFASGSRGKLRLFIKVFYKYEWILCRTTLFSHDHLFFEEYNLYVLIKFESLFDYSVREIFFFFFSFFYYLVVRFWQNTRK